MRKTLTDQQAENMLLGSGYRLVDAAASRGPGGDAAAVAFMNKYGGSMFTTTSDEYSRLFMNRDISGSLTPEQLSLPGAVATPKLGVAVVAALAIPVTYPLLAAIPGAPIFGVNGLLGSTAWSTSTGVGMINAMINSGEQYLKSGTINPTDAAVAFATGAAGSYGGLLWNVAINMAEGSATTALNNAQQSKHDSVVMGGVLAGFSSAFGYGTGKVMGALISTSSRPTLNSFGWGDANKWAGPSLWNLFRPNHLPVIGSGVFSGLGSVGANAAIDGIQNRGEQKK